MVLPVSLQSLSPRINGTTTLNLRFKNVLVVFSEHVGHTEMLQYYKKAFHTFEELRYSYNF